MKFFILLLATFSSVLIAAPHYLLMLDPLPKVEARLHPTHIVKSDGHLTLLKLDQAEIEQFSLWVHRFQNGCGGFLDVTEEVVGGTTPQALFAQEYQRKQYVHSSPQRVGTNVDVGRLVAQVDADQVWNFLTKLTQFPDRSATTSSGKDAAAFLAKEAERLAGHAGLTTRKVDTGWYYGQPSIVATLPGTDANAEGIVIGAHMDTFSRKPGADDDGSGSATVLELIRVIGQSGAKFRRSIHFVWYAAEERGLVGSKYVVEDFKKKSLGVRAALQLDMVGFDSPKDTSDIYMITDYTDSGLNQTVKDIVKNYVGAKVGETKCGYACSDHANWHRAGIPVVFPFETTFDNINEHIHTATDKMSFLSKGHAVRFGQLAIAFAGELAELTYLP